MGLDAIARHRHELERLVGRAEHLLAAGDAVAAAGVAQVAAHHACFNHAGAFAVEGIEAVCDALGALALPPPRAWQRPSTGIGRVLHVLTEAYDTGGHTRLAWRWMGLDVEREHHVVLTQRREPVPARLAAVATSITDLDGDLLDRAARLRVLAGGADAVVLHTHQWDVIAAIALGGWEGPRPPVLLLDHADNTCWVGAAAVDVVCSLRSSSAALAAERRGVPTDRITLLPIPLDATARTVDRAAAKATLGIDPAVPVVVTIGTAHKYETTDDLDLPTLLAPVLDDAGAVLVAVGPSPGGRWARPGVVALGPRPDVADVLQAADVYCDSWPTKGVTTLVEAAAFGVPSVTYSPPGQILPVLDSDDPALERLVDRSPTIEAFRSHLAALLADAEGRDRLGERFRTEVAAWHEPDGWRQRLEAAYALAAARSTEDRAWWPAAAGLGPVGHLDVVRQEQLAASGLEAPLGLVHLRHDPLLARTVRPALSVVTPDAVAGADAAVAAGELGLLDVEVVAGAASWQAGLLAASGHQVLLVSPDVRLDAVRLGRLLVELGRDPSCLGVAAADTAGLDGADGVCIALRAGAFLRGDFAVRPVPGVSVVASGPVGAGRSVGS